MMHVTQQDKIHRHDLRSDSQTVCGIDFNELSVDEIDVPLSCPCGRAHCKFPVTCPVCIAVMNKRAS